MCFVWIWEQTAIISLYSIKGLVCITETESVYCAVRTELFYICVCVYIYIYIYYFKSLNEKQLSLHYQNLVTMLPSRPKLSPDVQPPPPAAHSNSSLTSMPLRPWRTMQQNLSWKFTFFQTSRKCFRFTRTALCSSVRKFTNNNAKPQISPDSSLLPLQPA